MESQSSTSAGRDSTIEKSEEEEEMENLLARLQGLSSEARRKTMVELERLDDKTGKREEFSKSPRRTSFQSSQPMFDLSESRHQRSIVVDTTPRKIKNFSGSDKLGSGEVDFKHWRRAAIRIVEDQELSESRKRTVLLQSLTGLAEDAIDEHRNAAPRFMIDVLDKIFGSTADGRDMLADFFQVFQEPGQSSSQFLSKLYVKLTEIVERDGISIRALPENLIRQFVRGCSDEELITKLRLEDFVDDPPDFPTLVECIRKEEARRTERRLRLKRVSRTNSCASVVEKKPDNTVPSNTSAKQDGETEKLKERIRELEKERVQAESLVQRVNILEESVSRRDNKFCFRCGNDGHMAWDCSAPPNRALVEEKSKARRQRRQGNPRRLSQEATVGSNPSLGHRS